jgi:tRNA synthetases class I (I, L, M and V)
MLTPSPLNQPRTNGQRTQSGEILIAPKQSEAEWYRWLENIQDWCISRQLWWGHRCPAYFVRIEGGSQDVIFICMISTCKSNDRWQYSDGRNWVVGRTIEEATERARVLAGGSDFSLEQDEDVLDTWFSSGLWPFSIMGWPENVIGCAHIRVAMQFTNFGNADAGSSAVLPFVPPGNWMGYSLLLGRSYGLAGHSSDRKSTISRGPVPRYDSRRPRSENEQVVGQRSRPYRCYTRAIPRGSARETLRQQFRREGDFESQSRSEERFSERHTAMRYRCSSFRPLRLFRRW